MPAYQLSSAISSLGPVQKNFNLFTGTKGSELVIVVGKVPSKVLIEVALKIGGKTLAAKGLCHKEKVNDRPMIVFSTKNTSCESKVRQACSKGGVSTPVTFKQLGEGDTDEVSGPEADMGGDNPLPIPERPAPMPPGSSPSASGPDAPLPTDQTPLTSPPQRGTAWQEAQPAPAEPNPSEVPVFRTSMPPVKERKDLLKDAFMALQSSMVSVVNQGDPVVKADVLHEAQGFTQSLASDNVDAAQTYLEKLNALISEKLPADATPPPARKTGFAIGSNRIPQQQATEGTVPPPQAQSFSTGSFEPTPVGQQAETIPGPASRKLSADGTKVADEGVLPTPVGRVAQTIPGQQPQQATEENLRQNATLVPDPSKVADPTPGTVPTDSSANGNGTATASGKPPLPSRDKLYNKEDHYVPPMPDPPTLAWLRSVGTPRPPKPVDIKKKFTEKFPADRMAQLKIDVDRGFFKGAGDFKTILTGVEDLQNAFAVIDKYQTANPGPVNPQLQAKLLEKYDALVAKAAKYQANFEEDGTATNYGVFSRSKDNTDNIRKTKISFTNEVLQEVMPARAQLKMGSRFDLMGRLGAIAANGALTADQEQQYHELRAEFLLLPTPPGVVAADGGTSTVSLLRGTDNKVAYAFKNKSGESKLMIDAGVPVGGGTAQEVLTSKLSDVLAEKCGFQSGFPRTTLATLPLDNTGDAQQNLGALVEGLPGKPMYESPEEYDDYGKAYKQLSDAEISGLDARYAAAGLTMKLSGEGGLDYDRLLKEEQANAIRAIPPKEVQRIVLMNLLSCNADSKWQSVMFNGANPRPFDGGGAMVTADVMADVATMGDTGPLNSTFGMSMLVIPNTDPVMKLDLQGNLVMGPNGRPVEAWPGEPHQATLAPLDSEFVAQLSGLKVDEISEAMKEEMRNIQGANPILGNAVGTANIDNMVQSMTFMKEIIAANPTTTLGDFVRAYNAKMNVYLESHMGPVRERKERREEERRAYKTRKRRHEPDLTGRCDYGSTRRRPPESPTLLLPLRVARFPPHRQRR